MSISYKTDKSFSKQQIADLFAFTGWTTAQYPAKLTNAINNSHEVISAWDDEKLIGLISTISDGSINMFITYLLVLPDYQNKGIGQELMKRTLSKYEGFGRQILTTTISKLGKYYEQFGFSVGDEGVMFLKDWPEIDDVKEAR